MGRACGTHGEKRNACRILVVKARRKGVDVGGSIILKWILVK
jgi:hypothetical protein